MLMSFENSFTIFIGVLSGYCCTCIDFRHLIVVVRDDVSVGARVWARDKRIQTEPKSA